MFHHHARRRPLAAALLLVPILGAAACGSSSSSSGSSGSSGADGDRPTIVVTTGILGDVTEQVVGDLADVEVLLPPGADPHDFEPSASQVAEMTDADLIIANGLGLEEGLADTLESVAADGVPVFEVGEELSPIPFGGEPAAEGDEHADDEHAEEGDEHADDEHAEEGDEHEHGAGSDDPHFWMDPDRVATAATLIAGEVAAATGLDEAVLAEQAAAYADEVTAADEEIQAILAEVPDDRRSLVTNHEAFGYFAERYGFEIVGVVIPGGSTRSEASAEQIAELAAVVGETGVPAIFSDSSASPDLVEALAAEVGGEVEVVELYSESLGEPGSGADTYIGLITTNAQRIADALA